MPKIFATLDKLKPIYDVFDKLLMFVCKLLLVLDILITCMAVTGRYVPFIPDPSWSEEVVLTLMSYMAVLSAAIAIRHGTHIRMTALDKFIPRKVLITLDLLADIAVFILGIIMINVGLGYASTIGARGTYVSMPTVSRFWMYFPIPLAGFAMVVFELEAMYNHFKTFFIKPEEGAEEK